jgi:Domain of unknown function (DUF4926)
MFDENDVVELTKDIPEQSLKAGYKGTILMILSISPPVYEIEFMSDDGETIAVETVYEKALKLIWSCKDNQAE